MKQNISEKTAVNDHLSRVKLLLFFNLIPRCFHVQSLAEMLGKTENQVHSAPVKSITSKHFLRSESCMAQISMTLLEEMEKQVLSVPAKRTTNKCFFEV